MSEVVPFVDYATLELRVMHGIWCNLGMPKAQTLPYVSGSETSRAAAKSAQSNSRKVARDIYNTVVAAGDRGMTRDELVGVFGQDKYSTVTARVRDLTFSVLLKEGPETRKTRKGNAALVLTVVPGRDFDKHYTTPPPGAGKTKIDDAVQAAYQMVLNVYRDQPGNVNAKRVAMLQFEEALDRATRPEPEFEDILDLDLSDLFQELG